MMLLLSRDGLRWNDSAITAGAQTERRGEAGLVRDLPGGWDLTDRLAVHDIPDPDERSGFGSDRGEQMR